jgi:hypothetical protein
MEEHAKKHVYVYSACRLTTEEEILLMQLCKPDSTERLSLTSLATLPYGKSLTVKLGTELSPAIENFDRGPDTTINDNPKKTLISSKLFGAAYNRPEEVGRSILTSVFTPSFFLF